MDSSDKTTFYSPNDLSRERRGAEPKRPVVVILEGDRTSTLFEIPPGEITFGRDASCGMVLPENACSRAHARIIHAEARNRESVPEVTVEDLGSTNGTYLNGLRLEGPTRLSSGDKIRIGKTILGFYLWDEITLQAEDALLRSATTDALTGLFNRGFFQDSLRREFERSRRYSRPLSLVFLDIDEFKRFNDTHGHQAGDQVLREVGQIITGTSRLSDIPCRYGGEEISIILPETQLPGAMLGAYRMLERIRAHRVEWAGTSLSVTASIGVAELGSWMREGEDLVKAADQAMYNAKREGRNRICSSGNYGESSADTQPLAALKLP
jgi:two-component system cell cycle response regulator